MDEREVLFPVDKTLTMKTIVMTNLTILFYCGYLENKGGGVDE